MPVELLLLCCTAFVAGFVDAIVGGGGLIQTPLALVLLPQYPVATILGTNKIPSFTGTSIAAFQYAKRVKLQYRLLISISVCAFVASLAGSRLASLLSNDIFKPIILILLTGVLIYTFFNKQFGISRSEKVSVNAAVYAIASGLLIGFYDGFIGPGTGSFLILVFIAIMGQDFLHASAHAKLVNLATNFASILYFSLSGHILFHYAIPMAVCNAGGAFLGARFALLKGNKFIRIFFLLIVTATLVRLAWDLF